MAGYASAWEDRYSSRPNPRNARIAKKNRENCANGTRQKIGKPGGNNDARKKVEPGLLPVVRYSVVGRGI